MTPTLKINNFQLTAADYKHVEEGGQHTITLYTDDRTGPDVTGTGPTFELAVANLNGKMPDTLQVEIHIPV